LRRSGVAIVIVALALTGCARAGAAPSTATPQFRLDWQATGEGQASVVRGQLLNGHAVPARDIHLLVEGLDANGLVVTTTTSVLRRIVLAGDRAAFDVLVPGFADHFRVTVVSFDLVMPRSR
jgi:hypothetical protein